MFHLGRHQTDFFSPDIDPDTWALGIDTNIQYQCLCLTLWKTTKIIFYVFYYVYGFKAFLTL